MTAQEHSYDETMTGVCIYKIDTKKKSVVNGSSHCAILLSVKTYVDFDTSVRVDLIRLRYDLIAIKKIRIFF